MSPVVQLVQRHTEVAGNVLDGDLLIFHKLRIAVRAGDARVFEAEVKDRRAVCVAWAKVDLFPFAAQLIFQRDRRSVRAGQYAAALVLCVATEIGLCFQHAAGLAAVLIIRSVVLLCRARRGNDVLRTRQRSDAF